MGAPMPICTMATYYIIPLGDGAEPRARASAPSRHSMHSPPILQLKTKGGEEALEAYTSASTVTPEVQVMGRLRRNNPVSKVGCLDRT